MIKGRGVAGIPAVEFEREKRLSALMRESQAGNQFAYEQLLGEIMVLVTSYMRNSLTRWQRGADPAVVDDLVQEVLLAVHSKRHTYDPAQRFLPWLYAIARYKAIDRLRVAIAERRHFDMPGELPEPAEPPTTGNTLDAHAAIEALPENQREVLKLTKLEGLSVAEAARKTGLSESNVKVLTHRALKSLKKYFGGRDEE